MSGNFFPDFHSITLEAAMVIVDANSSINVSASVKDTYLYFIYHQEALGYNGTGGGHGGAGACCQQSQPQLSHKTAKNSEEQQHGVAYDFENVRHPNSFGAATKDGNKGGGCIRIFCPLFFLEGSLLANGGNAKNHSAGGGAGGSVFVNASQIHGSGQIEAKGGSSYQAGGGGGGTVAVETGCSGFTTTSVDVSGGTSITNAKGRENACSAGGSGLFYVERCCGNSSSKELKCQASGENFLITTTYVNSSLNFSGLNNLTLSSCSWQIEDNVNIEVLHFTLISSDLNHGSRLYFGIDVTSLILKQASRIRCTDASATLKIDAKEQMSITSSLVEASNVRINTYSLNIGSLGFIHFGSHASINATETISVSSLTQTDVPSVETTSLNLISQNLTLSQGSSTTAGQIYLSVTNFAIINGQLISRDQTLTTSGFCSHEPGETPPPIIDTNATCDKQSWSYNKSAQFSLWASVRNLTIRHQGEIRGSTVKICSDNVTILSGGSISGYGEGCSSERGIGRGESSSLYGGGGHGGSGGFHSVTSGGKEYDNTTLPIYFGSGGGGQTNGGSGGGYLWIDTSSLSINGTITVAGENVSSSSDSGGGGSGGSLVVNVTSLSGTGQLIASGGTGGTSKSGGGGGGIMNIFWKNASQVSSFSGSVLNNGGSGSRGSDSNGTDGRQYSRPSCDKGSGGVLCKKCTPGNYNNDSESNSLCEPCPLGQYAPHYGMSLCDHCTGKHNISNTTGAQQCISCSNRLANENNTACEDCLPGFENFDCSPCPAGQYKNTTGFDNCTYCPIGYFAAGTNSTVCATCPAGKVANDTGQSSCHACGKGSEVDTNGTYCTLCPAGKYSATEIGKCVSCRINTKSTEGKSTCSECLLGQYAPGGSKKCYACPEKPGNAFYVSPTPSGSRTPTSTGTASVSPSHTPSRTSSKTPSATISTTPSCTSTRSLSLTPRTTPVSATPSSTPLSVTPDRTVSPSSSTTVSRVTSNKIPHRDFPSRCATCSSSSHLEEGQDHIDQDYPPVPTGTCQWKCKHGYIEHSVCLHPRDIGAHYLGGWKTIGSVSGGVGIAALLLYIFYYKRQNKAVGFESPAFAVKLKDISKTKVTISFRIAGELEHLRKTDAESVSPSLDFSFDESSLQESLIRNDKNSFSNGKSINRITLPLSADSSKRNISEERLVSLMQKQLVGNNSAKSSENYYMLQDENETSAKRFGLRDEDLPFHIHRIYMHGINSRKDPLRLPAGVPAELHGVLIEAELREHARELYETTLPNQKDKSLEILCKFYRPLLYSLYPKAQNNRIKLLERSHDKYGQGMLRNARSRVAGDRVRLGKSEDGTLVWFDFLMLTEGEDVGDIAVGQPKLPLVLHCSGDGSYRCPVRLSTQDALVAAAFRAYIGTSPPWEYYHTAVKKMVRRFVARGDNTLSSSQETISYNLSAESTRLFLISAINNQLRNVRSLDVFHLKNRSAIVEIQEFLKELNNKFSEAEAQLYLGVTYTRWSGGPQASQVASEEEEWNHYNPGFMLTPHSRVCIVVLPRERSKTKQGEAWNDYLPYGTRVLPELSNPVEKCWSCSGLVFNPWRNFSTGSLPQSVVFLFATILAVGDLLLGYTYNATLWSLYPTAVYTAIAFPPLAFVLAPWTALLGLAFGSTDTLRVAVELLVQSYISWLIGLAAAIVNYTGGNTMGLIVGVGAPVVWLLVKIVLVQILNLCISWIECVKDRREEWESIQFPILYDVLQNVRNLHSSADVDRGDSTPSLAYRTK